MSVIESFADFRRPLPNGFELRGMELEEFKPLWHASYPLVFGEKAILGGDNYLTDSERESKEKLTALMGSPLCLRFGVFKDGRFVAWHIGNQKSGEEFYMRNTGVLPELQGQGIYAAMLKPIIEVLIEVGFQVVSSKHNATNNRVIIPKLKAGFVITGLEISDRFGTMVRLEYFTNSVRREMIDYRSGQSMPSARLKTLMGL